MNLAVNARDAMPDGGVLTISTANLDVRDGRPQRGLTVRPGPFVRLTVTDTGIGMDAKTMAHLFEPFFTTKQAGQGTGLGLSMVFGIVKQCGGQLTVHSEPSKGATFEIDFPRCAASPALRAAPPGHASVPKSKGTETVLVVEDEGPLLRIATRVLQSAGYTVLAAASGADALRTCERHPGPIHVVVSDIIMPGMSGVAFAERMKRVHPETRVLYMSGYTDDALAHQGVTDPQVQLLSKPFTPEQLRRKVREILDL
jgi:CheY-like chemotaxis protein